MAKEYEGLGGFLPHTGGCEPPQVQKSGFTRFFKQVNHIRDHKFKEWFFLPGMQFDSPAKWWGDFGQRKTPHEGLDLCMFKDGQDRIRRMESNMRIPAMYDGVTKAITEDILGYSVIIEHTAGSQAGRFCTMYAHTCPRSDLRVGMNIREGEVLSTVAGTEKSSSGIFPHLHISVGRLENGAAYDRLDWVTISRRKEITLFDPLVFIN